MDTIIPVENGDILAALRAFLRQLLEKGIVEALFVPLEAEDGVIIPALVTDPARLELCNPLAPVMPFNAARALALLTGKETPAAVGAVLRPCEIRALVELVKLQQAKLEGVTLISMDCAGTYEVSQYHQKWQSTNGKLGEYLAAAREGREPAVADLVLRPACQICNQPIPDNGPAGTVAIYLNLLGRDSQSGIRVTLWDEIGHSLEMTEIRPAEDSGAAASQAAIERLLASRNQAREKELAAMQSKLASEGGMNELFATCINCHNCKTACPICYCKICLFESESFRHEPAYYLKAAQRKGVLRLLPDTMLFHQTRLNHMVLSCVGCGMCSSACPMDIPVGTIFQAVGAQIQQLFAYHPGQNIEDALPLVTFQPDEWVEVGEER